MYRRAFHAFRVNFPAVLLLAILGVGLVTLRQVFPSKGASIVSAAFLWIFSMQVFLHTLLKGAPIPVFKRSKDPEQADSIRALMAAGLAIFAVLFLGGIGGGIVLGKYPTLTPGERTLAILAISGFSMLAGLLLFGSAMPAAVAGKGVGVMAALKRAPRLAPALAWRLLVGPGLVVLAVYVINVLVYSVWTAVLGLPDAPVSMQNLAPLLPMFVSNLLLLMPTALTAAALAVVWERDQA